MGDGDKTGGVMNSQTTIRELLETGKYGDLGEVFWTYITDDHLSAPLSRYGYEACDFEFALGRVERLVSSGQGDIFPIYTRQEIYEKHELSEARLIFFPPTASGEKFKTDKGDTPFALIIPGGGFARQWTLIEGFAIAARLNEMGLPAFVLLYRTAKKGVLSMAIDDMHRAISYILKNASAFGVSNTSYIMGGFSAGATLAATMATDNLGWRTSGLLKPQMIFIGYLAQKMQLFYDAYVNPKDSAEKENVGTFLSRLIEGEITPEILTKYTIEDHLSKEICPPLFFTANEDDPVVSFEHSYSLYQRATSLGIETDSRFGKTGGHSYGIGRGLEADGWLLQAIYFWQRMRSGAEAQ